MVQVVVSGWDLFEMLTSLGQPRLNGIEGK